MALLFDYFFGGISRDYRKQTETLTAQSVVRLKPGTSQFLVSLLTDRDTRLGNNAGHSTLWGNENKKISKTCNQLIVNNTVKKKKKYIYIGQ